MPSLFTCLGYKIYFWSNENGEPIHVHVCEGVPQKDATKIWLTSTGGCVVEHNKSRIPDRDLRELQKIISAQFFFIRRKWMEHFCVDDIHFHC